MIMKVQIKTIGYIALSAGTGKVYKKAATAKGQNTRAIKAKAAAEAAEAAAAAEAAEAAAAAEALQGAKKALKTLTDKRETAIHKRRWAAAKKWGHEVALIKSEFPSLR